MVKFCDKILSVSSALLGVLCEFHIAKLRVEHPWPCSTSHVPSFRHSGEYEYHVDIHIIAITRFTPAEAMNDPRAF